LLGSVSAGLGAEPLDLVNIRSVDPSIIVELRYSGTRNIAQRPLYPANMPALVRPKVAEKLAAAQAYLRERGYGLKIWDAYRPKAAHDQLWQYSGNNDYVANPADGRGSLHTWGVAVDATLVDKDGREMEMPTDFDSFTPAAMLYYKGNNQLVRRNVHRLQNAMAVGGFYGMRTEWWHFVSKDWQSYRAIPEIVVVPKPVVNGGGGGSAGSTGGGTSASNSRVAPSRR
jgi:D-alanyl-D-alanine dipeptidase